MIDGHPERVTADTTEMVSTNILLIRRIKIVKLKR